MPLNDSCLQINDLSVVYPLKMSRTGSRKWMTAVTGVSFELKRGETFCLVGETGSGKTTIGRVIVGLQKPSSGSVVFIDRLGRSWQLSNRWPLGVQQKIQMIFQDPFSSLNPRMRIVDLLKEGLVNYRIIDRDLIRERIIQLLEMVGLSEDFMDRYPNQLSGGERQRIAIARALSVEPEIVVCDEVVSALDVSMQALILELLKELQQRLNLSYVFITHDLNAANYLSHRIAVIYKGSFVEIANSKELIENPLHPYTRDLINASSLKFSEKQVIETTSENSDVNKGLCPFISLCEFKPSECTKTPPSWSNVQNDHKVRCNLYKK